MSLEPVAVFAVSALLLLTAWRRWLPLDLTEAFGFATGAICVWLVTKGNIWNWPVGLANNIVFAILFWRARLFADFGLQGGVFRARHLRLVVVAPWWSHAITIAGLARKPHGMGHPGMARR